MKIKDLPPNTNLGNIKVRTPEGIEGYWISQWEKGVFLHYEEDENPGNIHPHFVNDLKDTLEWEVIDNPNHLNL